MTYQEQLKHPRWQKKRLEILERDEWTCQACGDTDATLTVHHKSYHQKDGKFVDIWEYENETLVTLCEKCHTDEESCLKNIKEKAFYKLREIFENSAEIYTVLDYLDDASKAIGKRLTFSDVAESFTWGKD